MRVEPGAVERCAACGRQAPLVELLRITRVGRPGVRARYCCRPDSSRPCFGITRPRHTEAISWAASPEDVRAHDAARPGQNAQEPSPSAPVRSTESVRGTPRIEARR